MNIQLLKRQTARVRQTLAFLLAVLLCLHHVTNVEIPTGILSAVAGALLVTCVQRKMRASLSLLLFLVWTCVCLLLHPGVDFHGSMLRFMALCVGLMMFSPLLMGERLGRIRVFLLRCIFITFAVLVAVSFLLWLYSLAVSHEERRLLYHYGFRGAFDIGYSLAAASALTGIVAFFLMLTHKKKSYRIWCGSLLTICCICCVAGASRMVMVSFAVALLIVACLKFAELKRLAHNWKVIALCGVALMVVAVSMPGATRSLHRKMRFYNEYGQFRTREALWGSRVQEIESSPWTGVGYANESIRLDDKELFKNIDLGNRPNEPGSSWLSVVAYSGIVGAVIFLCYFASVVRALVRNRRRSDFALQASLLMFLSLYAVTEGWMLYSGAMMFPVFWLICSLICDERSMAAGESYLTN